MHLTTSYLHYLNTLAPENRRARTRVRIKIGKPRARVCVCVCDSWTFEGKSSDNPGTEINLRKDFQRLEPILSKNGG
jgi:hypothetical protein